jgi:hypothetical protein
VQFVEGNVVDEEVDTILINVTITTNASECAHICFDNNCDVS